MNYNKKRSGPVDLRGIKLCAACETEKSREDFPVCRTTKDFLYSYCKQCANEQNKARRDAKSAEEKEAYLVVQREKYYKREYGISSSDKNDMFSSQGEKCALCGGNDPRNKNGWCVDHCHRTGRVRGVLCGPCNWMLGHYEKGWLLPSAEACSTYIEES